MKEASLGCYGNFGKSSSVCRVSSFQKGILEENMGFESWKKRTRAKKLDVGKKAG